MIFPLESTPAGSDTSNRTESVSQQYTTNHICGRIGTIEVQSSKDSPCYFTGAFPEAPITL